MKLLYFIDLLYTLMKVSVICGTLIILLDYPIAVKLGGVRICNIICLSSGFQIPVGRKELRKVGPLLDIEDIVIRL